MNLMRSFCQGQQSIYFLILMYQCFSQHDNNEAVSISKAGSWLSILRFDNSGLQSIYHYYRKLHNLETQKDFFDIGDVQLNGCC
jgi:hypothetical protein